MFYFPKGGDRRGASNWKNMYLQASCIGWNQLFEKLFDDSCPRCISKINQHPWYKWRYRDVLIRLLGKVRIWEDIQLCFAISFYTMKDDSPNLKYYFIIRDVYRDMLKGPPWQQSDMIVAVYDVTREDTFEKVAKVAEGNFH